MKLGQLSREAQANDEVSIAPLIDIVFILLIFFMVTTTFAQDFELDIERPSAQSAEKSAIDSIRVAVDHLGGTAVQGKTINRWVLQARVRDVLSDHPSRTVLVVADERVPTGELVEVVDQCRLAGASEVGVATLEGS